MGDYATRLCDGEHIKVGSCGAMYYCRYEQINEIEMDGHYNLDGCTWRIPLPSEDGIKPGDYEYGGLLRDGWCVPYDLRLKTDEFDDETKNGLLKNVGIVQTAIKTLGLVLNVPCHHGLKLPEVGDRGVKAFWNGKNEVLHLCFLKNDEKELLVGFRCSACNSMWTCPFNEIEPYIVSLEMKLRLFRQCTEYWINHHQGVEHCPYRITEKYRENRLVTMFQPNGNIDNWVVDENGDIATVGGFEHCLEWFRNRLNK